MLINNWEIMGIMNFKITGINFLMTTCTMIGLHDLGACTDSLVNAHSFYAYFHNTTYEKVAIPHLTHNYYEIRVK